MNVKAEHAPDMDFFDEDHERKPGQYNFYSAKDRDIAGMFYVCPCGCGAASTLDFRPHPSPSWNWNGDKDNPTLTPSVFRNKEIFPGVCGWHGFLTKGVWISC